MKKNKSSILFLALILFIVPMTVDAGVAEGVDYEGYLDAYEDLLEDFLEEEYSSLGYDILRKDAYLLSDFAYEYPLLFTNLYYENPLPEKSILTGSMENYIREERAYYYKDGKVYDLTLIRFIDPTRDSIYNRQPINSLNKADIEFPRNRAIARGTGDIYHYEIDEDTYIESWDEWGETDEWEGDGYYRTGIHLHDRSDGGHTFISLVKERNSKGQYRYLVFNDNEVIEKSKSEYERLVKEWEDNLELVQENPRTLTRKDIDSILQESSFHSIKVVMDGRLLNFDSKPVIEESRVLVPIRKILEELDMELTWDEKAKEIVARGQGTEISFTVDKRQAYVDGKIVELDAPAKIIDGRTLIPLRFISSSLGKDVRWDGEDRVVYIND